MSQDIHFSQFYASPLSLNPAETGFFDANWRFSNNYRTQWSAIGVPFRTISVGFDKPFRLNSKSDLGLGVFVVNDNSGHSKLTVNKIFLSTSYIRHIKKYHSLSFAIQVGYVFKSFSGGGLTFPDQFNPGTGVFDPELQTNFRDYDNDLNYPDINAGISYSYNSGNIRPYAGVSIFHLNTPKESFLNSSESKLPIRMVFNGGLNISLSDNLVLNPNFLTMYNKKASDWIFGSLLYYYIPNKNIFRSIFVGLHTRTALHNFDAVITTAGVNIFGFEIGVSYDINISHLRAATKYRGAIELSLIYKDISKKPIKITIPCDRY
jgi:type IX secretion system PorP/SprF family membrane protein